MHYDDAIDEETGNDRKPEIITSYNKTKSGVDVVDKMCASYNVARNTRRWPMVIFFSMLNMAGINSQVIVSKNGSKVIRRRLFLRQLVTELALEHLKRRKLVSPGLPKNLQLKLGNMFPQSPPQENENVQRKRKACVPCAEVKKRRLSNYYCKKCENALCLQHACMVCQGCYDNKQNVESDSSLHD